MNGSPSGVSNTPPSPRTASEIKNFVAPGMCNAVGWNWMYSRLITRAPAR